MKFIMFSVPMYTPPGIAWDTHWHILGHCIYLQDFLSVFDNINKHRPRIIKFVHSLSYENQEINILSWHHTAFVTLTCDQVKRKIQYIWCPNIPSFPMYISFPYFKCCVQLDM